ncbi:MAG: hypothetical protein IPK66_17695 [Rhodospirillales bacterium]|nr:hypothetical protein [Rhodospirillales bacterium]
MAPLQKDMFSHLAKYNLCIGRMMLGVWALLVVHYILGLVLGVSFDGVANYFAPFLADLPIFPRVAAYYAHNPEALAQARSFYLVNNGIFFPALAICLISALANIMPAYRAIEQRIEQEEQKTEARKKWKDVRTSVFAVLLCFYIISALVTKLAGYTQLPEQGVGRGFAVILGQFLSITFILATPHIIAPSLYTVFHTNNKRNTL